MALKAAMWVHGTAVEIEGTVDAVVRRGTGVFITGREDASARFCFPIPTPVILDDRRLRLVRVFVFYDTLPQSGSNDALGPRITSVRVFDGPKLAKSFDNLGLIGPHDKSIDASNTWSCLLYTSPSPRDS